MATLPDGDRLRIYRGLMRYWSRIWEELSGVQKAALKAAVDKARRIINGRTYKCEIERGGDRIVVHSSGRLAIELDRQWHTVRNWLKQGLLPPPTYVDDNGSQYFSLSYIEAMGEALSRMEIDGKLLVGRPEDRLKKTVKRLW